MITNSKEKEISFKEKKIQELENKLKESEDFNRSMTEKLLNEKNKNLFQRLFKK